jgi:rRNA processing protein Gar1
MTVKQDSSFPNNEHDCDNNNNVNSGSLDTQQKVGFSYIILGKILEVFGPVSKPLYTVRLQEWNTRVNDENNVKNDINNDGSNTDESKKVVEETSLFGDESEVDNEHNLKEKPSSHEKTELYKDEELMENESQLNSPSDSKVSLKNSESDRPDLNKNNSLLNPSEHIEKNEIKAKNLDPWSPPGILTNFIKNNEKVQVYYLDGQVKLVDTQAVVRNSGKGCGK